MPPRLDVHSETGRLRRVLIHRPGREINLMVPSMMEELLFDDILDGEQASREHERFCAVIAKAGVEVFDAEALLGDVLERPAVREEVMASLRTRYGVAAGVVEELGGLPARALAEALIRGLRGGEPDAHGWQGHFFDLPPVPNYFFQRDPQIVIGDRVVFSSMATAARDREPHLARTIFRHHPALGGAVEHVEIHVPPHDRPDLGPLHPFPRLEGGDVLVPSAEVLLVGVSERTNRRGVEALAEHLRRAETSFRHLLLVDLPPRRSFMHLDTVFTFVDRSTVLAYPPVIHSGTPESAAVYTVDLTATELSFRLGPSLLEALAAVGLEVEAVPCGGGDLIDQQREQWTDGANAFALAPGVVLLYRRNRRTLDELDRRGFRVLDESEALAPGVDLVADGPTVIAISGNELSRARGGPRCMTMPLEREP